MQPSFLVACAYYSTLALATLILTEERTDGCPSPIPAYLRSVNRQFRTDGIIPDLIERINPTVRISVSYGTKQVRLGTYFTTLETSTQPNFSITAETYHDPLTTTYSLFLIDPDMPARSSPVQVNFAQWIVSHLQPACVNNQTLQQTTLVYEPPTPASTTQHRYTFLVYREPPGYEPDTAQLQIRTPFDINDYVDSKGLILVGGNFFKESITNGLQGG